MIPAVGATCQEGDERQDGREPLRDAELRASSGLELSDCCVLGIAIRHQALQPSTTHWPRKLQNAAYLLVKRDCKDRWAATPITSRVADLPRVTCNTVGFT